MAKGLFFVAVFVVLSGVSARIVNKFKCPEVRAVPHFDLEQVCFCFINPPVFAFFSFK